MIAAATANVTNTDIFNAAWVSALMIPVVSFIKQEHWSKTTRVIVATIVSLVAGFIATGINHSITSFQDAIALAMPAFGSSQFFYQLYFKGSEFENKLTKIGLMKDKTDPTSGPDPIPVDHPAYIADNTLQPVEQPSGY